MRRLLSVLAFLATAPLFAQSTVTPSVTCWTEATGSGVVTVVFGYTNTSAAAVALPVGVTNFFSPAPMNRLQPTLFQPGTTTNAFRVTVPVSEVAQLSWSLDGLVVTPDIAIDPNCSLCFCPAGPAGTAGVQGTGGAEGLAGPAGAMGTSGDPGPQGPAGAIGPAGPVGATGTAGVTGPVGPAGVAGAQGSTGPAGPQGLKGPVGDQGAAAAPGPAGPAGLAGEAGPKGAAGVIGPTGPAGAFGSKGPAGNAGPQGAIGPAGPKGTEGPQGLAGPNGGEGSAGAPGARGTDGAVSFIAASSATIHSLSSVMIHIAAPATIVVTGALDARAFSAAEVRVAVDEHPTGLPIHINAGSSWTAFSVLASYNANEGDHVVQLVAPEGVELGNVSISVYALASSPVARRRAVNSR